jgi:hypothetical protein
VVLVETRVREGYVRDAVGNEFDPLVGIPVNFPQHPAGPPGHDHDARGHVDQFLEDAALIRVGVLQDGVQRGDHGHAGAMQEAEQVAAGGAPVNPELVLHAEGIDVGQVEKVGRADIGGHVGLGNLETHVDRIAVLPGAVRDGDNRAVPARIGLGQRVAQVARESGDAALARRIVAEERNFADGGVGRHLLHCRPPAVFAKEKFVLL